MMDRRTYGSTYGEKNQKRMCVSEKTDVCMEVCMHVRVRIRVRMAQYSMHCKCIE